MDFALLRNQSLLLEKLCGKVVLLCSFDIHDHPIFLISPS
jgi:hypothetical protein